MEIKHATIYGFGKWVDYTIDFSSETGVCIYGENESGKSTIQKFILFMLFGLPPKQRAYYRPKTSGKMGGRLTVLDSRIGEYTIERLDEVRNGAAVCYTVDGNVHEEDWLKERLQGMTRETYQSIYSFSALDLNDIQEMKADDLGEVLLGVGLTGSTKIYKLEKQLEQKMGELFKPFGKKPVINEQTSKLHHLYATLKEYKENETTYLEKRELQQELMNQEETLLFMLQNDKLKLKKLERMIQALPVLFQYNQYKMQLEKYPNVIEFPEQGVNRLTNIKRELLPLESELSILEMNEKNYQEKIVEIEEKSKVYHQEEELQSLLNLKQSYFEWNKELLKLKEKVEKWNLQIESELNRLQLGIQEEELETLSLPFYIENTWNEIKKEKERLDFEQEKVEQENRELKQERNYLLNQMQEVEDRLLPETDYHYLKEKIESHAAQRYVQEINAKQTGRKKSWKGQKKKKEKQLSITFIIFVLLAIITAGVALGTSKTNLLLLSLLFLLFGIGQWFIGKRSIREMELMFETIDSPSIEQEKQEEDDEQAELKIQRHEENISTINAYKKQLQTNEVKQLSNIEKRKSLSNKLLKLEEEIKRQYQLFPFLKHVDIAYWTECYHELEQLLNRIKERRAVKEKTIELDERIEEISTQIDDYFKEHYGRVGLEIKQQLEMMEDSLATLNDWKQQIKHYKELLQDTIDNQQKLRRKIEVYQDEINALFKVAKVDSEEEFYQKEKERNEKEDIEEKYVNTHNQLKKIISIEEINHYINSDMDEGVLEIEKEKLERNIDKLEKEIESVRKQLVEIKVELEQMESSEDYSKALHRFEMEKESINKLAKKWAVWKTAKDILSETKTTYQNKYLTKVIEITTYYFKQLTGNKYLHIYPPTDTSLFQVEDENGLRYTVNELSQGTINQLYTCLRLAITETMSERHQLPFMIDDAFVHFDEIRTRRIMDLIENRNRKGKQVILFTCKKEIVDFIQSMKKIEINKFYSHNM